MRHSTLKSPALLQAHLDEMQLATSAPPRYIALPFPHLHMQQRAPAAAPALPPLRILVAEDNLVGPPCTHKLTKPEQRAEVAMHVVAVVPAAPSSDSGMIIACR